MTKNAWHFSTEKDVDGASADIQNMEESQLLVKKECLSNAAAVDEDEGDFLHIRKRIGIEWELLTSDATWKIMLGSAFICLLCMGPGRNLAFYRSYDAALLIRDEKLLPDLGHEFIPESDTLEQMGLVNVCVTLNAFFALVLLPLVPAIVDLLIDCRLLRGRTGTENNYS